MFLVLEDLHVIRGSRFYYFYEDGMIYRSSEALKAKAGDFFDYMERQTGGNVILPRRNCRRSAGICYRF